MHVKQTIISKKITYVKQNIIQTEYIFKQLVNMLNRLNYKKALHVKKVQNDI